MAAPHSSRAAAATSRPPDDHSAGSHRPLLRRHSQDGEPMTKRITKLTPEQQAFLPAIKDAWLAAGFSTQPACWHDAVLGIHAAYLTAGLTPPRIIIRVASPWAGA